MAVLEVNQKSLKEEILFVIGRAKGLVNFCIGVLLWYVFHIYGTSFFIEGLLYIAVSLACLVKIYYTRDRTLLL